MAKESNSSSNVPLTKQAAGAVTGAVAGSIVAGPAGVIVGGLAGAVMGHRVEQGKPAVPTEAVAAAKSAAKQVSRVPFGKAVRSLTAKAGVLKKTKENDRQENFLEEDYRQENRSEKTGGEEVTVKTGREVQVRKEVGPPIINCFAGHLHPPIPGGRLPRAGKY